MPQIRDYTMNYDTATASALVAYAPWYQAGDVLLAVANSKNTVAQTWANTVATVTGNITATTANIYSFTNGTPISPMTTISGTGITAGTQITGQVASFLPANVVVTAVSGGTIGTCTFVANSTVGMAINQFITGTGVPISTYISNIVGNVVTLTQNFTASAAGTYGFYLAGATGQYTVNTSQAVANVAITVAWSSLYSTTGLAVNGAILYKIASGYEPDPTFTITTSSTKQVHLIAVQDVNPALPFGGPTIPQNYNGNVLFGNIYVNTLGTAGYVLANTSATFTATISSTTMTVTAITKGTIIPGQVVTGGTAGAATSAGQRIVNQQSGAANIAWANTSPSIQSSNAIILSSIVGNIQPGLLMNGIGGLYSGTYVRQYWPGNTTVLLSQSVLTAGSLSFAIPGGTGTYTVSISQTATTATRTSGLPRGVMPQITTANANSMLMYINVDSTATTTVGTIPMVLEGPCVYEQGTDAFASSQGWSWGMLRTAGTSPGNVYHSKLGVPETADGLITTLNINPPVGGATIIPTYVANDASYLIDPLSGSSSYNQNIVPVTASGPNILFGTSLNGTAYTLANATVTVNGSQDVGINSYHSMAQITGTGVNKQWGGTVWSQAAVNKTDVTGKNILLHLKPNTPKALQNTDGIGRTGVKGLAFGMVSTPGSAYKVWHVHGQGTVWNAATFVPVVINSNATKGLIGSAGSLNPASISHYAIFLSGTVLGPIWNFGSQWALDTTTIAGGNVNNPMTMYNILHAGSDGKERLSLIEQGNGQMLVLQPLQVGNGGTDPVYMNLDSTVIEFPKQYDVPTNQVYYCSADNVAGLTYYAGPTDTIIHTNSVISSFSPFFWRFNPSTSASATYNFAGTRVFGAGNIVLNSNVTLSSMTFSNCVEILSPGGSINSTTFAQTTATTGQGAVKITGSSNVAIQSALTNLSNCTFTTNTTGSGALHIVYTGTSTSNAAVILSTSSLAFINNNYDIYWEAPVWTPLTIQQTGSATTLLAKTWQATNNNTVYLPPIRTLVINNIIEGSNVSVYTQASPTLAIAGPTTFNSSNYNNVVGNLYVGNDTTNSGRYSATYSFVYTTAFGSSSGTSLVLTIATTVSGTITAGQTVNGNGVPTGTVVSSVVGSTVNLNQTVTVPAGTYLTFDTPINIAVLTSSYQALRPQATLVYGGTTITVNQLVDRQYTNPA